MTCSANSERRRCQQLLCAGWTGWSRASKVLKGTKVSLVAYTAKLLNAHEADHGVIVISSAAWSKDNAMAQDEVVAMLAHEVAHLELKDSKRMACEALAYVSNTELTLPSAIQETTREAHSGNSHLSLTLATLSRHLDRLVKPSRRKRGRCTRRTARRTLL